MSAAGLLGPYLVISTCFYFLLQQENQNPNNTHLLNAWKIEYGDHWLKKQKRYLVYDRMSFWPKLPNILFLPNSQFRPKLEKLFRSYTEKKECVLNVNNVSFFVRNESHLDCLNQRNDEEEGVRGVVQFVASPPIDAVCRRGNVLRGAGGDGGDLLPLVGGGSGGIVHHVRHFETSKHNEHDRVDCLQHRSKGALRQAS